MSKEQPGLVIVVVGILAAPLAVAAYLDRDGAVTTATAAAVKEEAKKINGFLVDRLVDGTGAVFDGRGAVWICASEEGAKRFANAFPKRGFKCIREN